MFGGKPVATLLVLVSLILVGALTQGCVTAGEYERLKQQLAKANDELDIRDQRIEELDHERLVYEEESLALNDEISRFREHSAQADAIIEDLRRQLESANDKPVVSERSTGIEGIEIFQSQKEGTGIRFTDDVLFDTASNVIKPDARKVLDMLAGQLKQRGNQIRVVGHTDSVPIVKPATKKKYPHGNIQLSVDRALAVFNYLKKKGVDENRMCVIGYGPHKPLVENNSVQNKRKNRRVEIILGD